MQWLRESKEGAAVHFGIAANELVDTESEALWEGEHAADVDGGAVEDVNVGVHGTVRVEENKRRAQVNDRLKEANLRRVDI